VSRSWLALSLFLAAGCADELEPPVEPTGEPGASGIFVGDLHVDLRAYWGPVRVAHAVCETELTMVVDPDAEDLITGYGDCGRLPDFGRVQVEVWGGDVDMPEVGGDYYSDPFWDTWQGWFLSAEELWALAEGKGPWEGYRIRWEAEMDAWRVSSLEDAWLDR
jgi:hypothetical protein